MRCAAKPPHLRARLIISSNVWRHNHRPWRSRSFPTSAVREAKLKLFIPAVPLLLAFAMQTAAEPEIDYKEMRAYVLSKLTDEQVREAHRLAQKDYEQNLKMLAKQQAEADVRAQEKWVKCSDIAYRTKNESACMPGYPVKMEPTSKEQFFELRLMKGCMFVSTRQKAKEAGCLPG